MSTAVVEQILYLMDAAFEGDDWHSLERNLRDITHDEWTWEPFGGGRTLRDIVQHVAGCKYMYADHAFGDASLGWDDTLVSGEGRLPVIEEALSWLREGHKRLRQEIAALDDDGLSRPRRTNWGELRETRWIVAIMIQHDLYHAGEINHLRSLYSGDDRWQHEREPSRSGSY